MQLFLSTVFSIVLFLSQCFVNLAADVITEIITKDDSFDHLRSSIWCPTFLVGTQCPEHSLISYYKCCGHLHKQCCSHLRVWVLILIIALPILFLIPPTVYLLRRLLCRTPEGYTAGIPMTSRSEPPPETSKEASA